MKDIEALAVQEDEADTATQLLDVAERMLADQGLERVSLRAIVRASGQSNPSAAHYHFGTRDALVKALLSRRIRMINVVRHQRLDALEAQGHAKDIHALMKLTVGVLADVVKGTPWGADYVRVVSQYLFTSEGDDRVDLDREALSGQARMVRLMRAALPGMAPQVFRDRSWLVNNQIVYSIARWVHVHGRVTPDNVRRYNAMVRNLAEFLASGMAAGQGASEPIKQEDSGA
ncbi:MAG: TetR/AcrR family transcriptional regulator [Longimicrobiales bacterium]